MTRQPWARHELQTLAAMHGHYTYEQIAAHLERSVHSVGKKIGRLIAGKLDHKINAWELPANQRDNTWSAEDVDTLKALYFSVDNKDIAEKLNRSPVSIRIYANRLGLRKKPHERKAKEVEYEPMPVISLDGAFADVFMIPRPVVGARLCSPLGGW